ncbi:hypothetical protein HYV57_02745 [Candidatus Peregrinibacteria bacterium]|nr:hypothetical protein [Candidatus Peregrinibacteria bacterium]
MKKAKWLMGAAIILTVTNGIIFFVKTPVQAADIMPTTTIGLSGWVQSDTAIYTRDSGKNVGIGTSTPQTKLDVNGNLNINGALDSNGTINANENLNVSGELDLNGNMRFSGGSGNITSDGAICIGNCN